MTRPWKHPNSGFYWFRKRVPDDLRQIIGKREERFSLGTREPNEAKRLHALKLAEVEERWSISGGGQQSLSSDDIAREAVLIGDQVRRQLEADPYQIGKLMSVRASGRYRPMAISMPISIKHFLQKIGASSISSVHASFSLMTTSQRED